METHLNIFLQLRVELADFKAFLHKRVRSAAESEAEIGRRKQELLEILRGLRADYPESGGMGRIIDHYIQEFDKISGNPSLPFRIKEDMALAGRDIADIEKGLIPVIEKSETEKKMHAVYDRFFILVKKYGILVYRSQFIRTAPARGKRYHIFMINTAENPHLWIDLGMSDDEKDDGLLMGQFLTDWVYGIQGAERPAIPDESRKITRRAFFKIAAFTVVTGYGFYLNEKYVTPYLRAVGVTIDGSIGVSKETAEAIKRLARLDNMKKRFDSRKQELQELIGRDAQEIERLLKDERKLRNIFLDFQVDYDAFSKKCNDEFQGSIIGKAPDLPVIGSLYRIREKIFGRIQKLVGRNNIDEALYKQNFDAVVQLKKGIVVTIRDLRDEFKAILEKQGPLTSEDGARLAAIIAAWKMYVGKKDISKELDYNNVNLPLNDAELGSLARDILALESDLKSKEEYQDALERYSNRSRFFERAIPWTTRAILIFWYAKKIVRPTFKIAAEKISRRRFLKKISGMR